MKKIPVSWLKSYAYCEYQVYLEHRRGAVPQVRPETARSRAARVLLEEVYDRAAKLELGVEEAMARAGAEGIAVSARAVAVEGVEVEGCIDEVVFMPERILVVDDRPGDMAWPGSRMQSWGYCLAFEEQYQPLLPIMAGIRCQETGFEIWAQLYTPGHRQEVRRAVLRIRQLLDGEAIAVGTRNRRKCQQCPLASSCDVRAG